jgi:gamma-glutamyltranspeptidase
MHHQWLPDRVTLEETFTNQGALGKLRQMGHTVNVQGRQGDAHTIWIAPDGTPYGVNDKRSADSKASTGAGLTTSSTGR